MGMRVHGRWAAITLCWLWSPFEVLPGFAQIPSAGALPEIGFAGSQKPEMPPEILGAWQVRVDGKTFKLKDSYNIEIKFNGARNGMPEALVAYFAGDARRPSSLCRSQLDLISNSDGQLIFKETLNYKSDRSAKCPVWGRLIIDKSDGGILFRWQDAGERKPKTRMEASALRLNGGRECRTVGDGNPSGGQIWCRDSEGNWAPK